MTEFDPFAPDGADEPPEEQPGEPPQPVGRQKGPQQRPGPNDPPTEPLSADEEPVPPEPTFLIVRNAYGPGAHSVKFPDGTPVGVWQRERNLHPNEVREILTENGMPDDLVEFFVRTRQAGIDADKALAQNPAVHRAMLTEAARNERMEAVRAEFLKAQAKK